MAETYPLDIEGKQVVRWLLDQERAGALELSLRITRSYMLEDAPLLPDAPLGDEDAEDLQDVVVVGEIEATPPPGRNGWLLRVRVENPIGPRTPEDEPAPEGEEEIDLETFYAEFISPRSSGPAFVELETSAPRGKARFQRLFERILTYRPRARAKDAGGRRRRRS